MKKIAIAGSVAVVGAGIWYVFFSGKSGNIFKSRKNNRTTTKEESGTDRIREVLHKAKEKDISPESI